MKVEIWSRWLLPVFEWPGRWEAYLVLAAYAVGLLALLARARRDFALRRSRLVLFLLLLIVTPPLNSLLLLRFDAPGLLPPPYRAAEPMIPGLPLLGFLPVAAAAAWTGVGPAALVGLVAGVFRAGSTTHGLLESFNLAFQAALAAYLLRQEYRGLQAQVARQPFVALLAGAILTLPLVLLSTFAPAYRPDQPSGELVALDYAGTLSRFMAQLALLEAVTCGLVLQIVYLVVPRLRPVTVARRPPPYASTLNLRLQFLFIPLFGVMIVALVYAVGTMAMGIATNQAVDAMVRDATNGAEGIWQFVSTGQSLIRQFAVEPELWSDDPEACRARLQVSVQMVPYFNRLTAYDAEGRMFCTYPDATAGETEPTADESELIGVIWDTGGLQTTGVHRGPDGQVLLSFLSPLEQQGDGERHGVLVGRVEIELNPMLDQVLTGLQSTMHLGEGFVVDNQGRIVVHRMPGRLLETWRLDQSQPAFRTLPEERGWVRESLDSHTNARQLACYVAAEGYPWGVVILLPHAIVLGQAISIAAPLVVLLTVLTAAVGVFIHLATGQLTRPLNLLARAAERIAEGDLQQLVHVAGDDEVARVGEAFEEMRARLKGRLEDLSLLLQVSQDVSATLDVAQGMPRILEGALQATGAVVSRIVLLSAAGEPQVVIGRGQTVEGLSALDRALALGARDAEHPLPIENLRRARTLAESGPLLGDIQAVIALPVRSKGRAVAVMWVGYPEARRFDPSEVDLLSTLASQTAVLIENARLFQMAEGGRRRLAAILTSTGDAVLVTDRDDRLLLVNPAAERTLDLHADEVVGKRMDLADLGPDLSRILTEPLGRTGPLVEEVPLSGGRTFYASASTIMSADGENMGRVVVMRDITHFKELDEMKSEFVATVSHDLRAPLTFMRGYATMLPMVGELNEKQLEYLDKILVGVEKMGSLIADLLNLGRIEAGVGIEERACHLGAVVLEAVDGLRARAAAKGLTLRLESSEPAPVTLGDATLLRQAIANLVDNAVKYTPSGGSVTVDLRSSGEEALIIVSDTGVGIAPEDQVRLFERFYRIRRRDLGDVPGSGLGLAIVKSIVGWHSGRVSVESALDRGSTFTISLPLRTPPQPENPGE